MYPRNAASPEPIAIGAVVQISDGVVQTSGCTVRIKPIGVAEGDGAGTTAYSTDGIVIYTPTQGETNYTSFILIAKKTGCIPVSITVVTSASSTPGTVEHAGTIKTLDALDAAQDSQHSTTQTAIADVPTVSEFNARTLAAADYFDPATDTVAQVTLVATTSTVTDGAKSATALSTVTWTGTLATNIGTTNSTVATNLNATITSRMATWTPPTGFLAATFPTTVGDATAANQSTLLDRLTSSRAGYLDNLNVGGAVASNADILALNQSASRRILLTTVGQYERPESGSTVYTVEARTFDGDGAATNADSNPTLTGTGQTTGSLAANIGTISNPATGVYRWAYTVASGATIEPIRFDISATMTSAFTLSVYAQVVDFVSATWTSTDASKLTSIYNKLPSSDYLTGTASSNGSGYATPTNVSDAQTAIITQVDANEAKIDTLTTNLATVDGIVNSILLDTAEIGSAGAGLTALAQSSIWTSTLATNIGTTNSTVATNLNATISSRSSHTAANVLSALGTGTWATAIPWNAAWDAEVQSEVQDAIEVNHLDHLLAVDYDPASKPGVSTALLNEIIGNDAGVSQFTANALELGPSGGGGGLDAAGVRAAVGLASANLDTQLADIPTVSEFNARTIPSNNYFDPATDTVANVTTVATTTNLTNLPAITTNWLTAAGLASDAVAEIQSGLATSASIAALNNLSAAQVNAEVDTAIADARLDELLAADSDIDGAAPPTVGSVFHELMSKTTGSFTYDQTTDSSEAIRDRGDAAWTTATGFSTHSAADVWAVGTRVLTAGTNIILAKGVGVTGFNDIAATAIVSAGAITTLSGAVVNVDTVDTVSALTTNNDKTGYSLSAASIQAIWDALTSALTTVGSIGKKLADWTIGTTQTADVATVLTRLGTPSDLGSGATVSANLVDIESQTDDIGAAGAGLTALATQASVNTIDDFLDTEIAAIKAKTDNLPASPANETTLAALVTTVGVAGAGLTAADDATIAAIAALNNLSAAQVNAEVLDVIGVDVLVAGVTIKESLRRIGAITSGKVTNAGTGVETFKDYSDSASTIVVTVDSSGNRAAITYN